MLKPTEIGLFSDTLTCPANEREIIIDDFCTAKSRSTHRLRQLIWVTDQVNVNTMPDLLHSLAKSCIRL